MEEKEFYYNSISSGTTVVCSSSSSNEAFVCGQWFFLTFGFSHQPNGEFNSDSLDSRHSDLRKKP